jgi:hypothetical protein
VDRAKQLIMTARAPWFCRKPVESAGVDKALAMKRAGSWRSVSPQI